MPLYPFFPLKSQWAHVNEFDLTSLFWQAKKELPKKLVDQVLHPYDNGR